jgi:O-antigen ligase
VVAAAAVVGGLVVVVGYQLLLSSRHLLTFGASVDASAAAQAASDAARLSVYKAGFQLVLQHPLLGVGYGQFHYVSAGLLGRESVTFSHDIYLGIAAEQGIPAIAIFLAALAAIFYALWRRRDAVAVTAAAMLAAFAVGSLFAENLTALQTSCILWVALGCALAGRTSDDTAPGAAERLRRSAGPPGDESTGNPRMDVLSDGLRSTAGGSIREPRPAIA